MSEITLEMTYCGKGVKAILPDTFSIEQKRKVFDICREALLRDEREALLRAALAEQGFQYEVIREVVVPECGYCRNCKWWHAAGYSIRDDQRVPTWGWCKRTMVEVGEQLDRDSKAVVIVGECDDGELGCDADFGCLQFEFSVKAQIEAIGLDYNAVVAASEAAKLIVRPEDILA